MHNKKIYYSQTTISTVHPTRNKFFLLARFIIYRLWIRFIRDYSTIFCNNKIVSIDPPPTKCYTTYNSVI